MAQKRRELERKVQSEGDIRGALVWVRDMTKQGLPAGPVVVRLGRERRTLDQNAKLWPMLEDVRSQVDWYGFELSCEDWKHIFTAALRSQRVVPGLEGGFVALGLSTSRMTKAELSDLVELIYSFGSERGVIWSEKAQTTYHENRRAANDGSHEAKAVHESAKAG